MLCTILICVCNKHLFLVESALRKAFIYKTKVIYLLNIQQEISSKGGDPPSTPMLVNGVSRNLCLQLHLSILLKCYDILNIGLISYSRGCFFNIFLIYEF